MGQTQSRIQKKQKSEKESEPVYQEIPGPNYQDQDLCNHKGNVAKKKRQDFRTLSKKSNTTSAGDSILYKFWTGDLDIQSRALPHRPGTTNFRGSSYISTGDSADYGFGDYQPDLYARDIRQRSDFRTLSKKSNTTSAGDSIHYKYRTGDLCIQSGACPKRPGTTKSCYSSRLNYQTSDYESAGSRDLEYQRRCFADISRGECDADVVDLQEQSSMWRFDSLYMSRYEGDLEQRKYLMDNRYRGCCIIFNVQHVGGEIRNGTNVDVRRLTRCFEFLGFSVYVKQNPTKADIISTIRKYTERDNSNHDCFACVILSHGRDGHVRSCQDEDVPLLQIMDPVKKCSSLLGKPKLFFIQACRGTNTDRGIYVTDAVGDNTQLRKLASHIDVLVSYATVEDHVAYRNGRDGSVYIHILTGLLRREGFSTNLPDLLVKVTDMTSAALTDCFQVPCHTSTLTKVLKFTPKKRLIKKTYHYDDGTCEEFNPDESF